PEQFVLLQHPGCNKKNRNITDPPDPPAHLKTVHSRKHHIQKDHLETGSLRRADCLIPLALCPGFPAFSLKIVAHCLCQQLIILHNENFQFHLSPSCLLSSIIHEK